MRIAITTIAMFALPQIAAGATVYRCSDESSRVSFQQTPCRGDGVAVALPPPNVVDGNPPGDASLRAQAQRNALVRQAIASGQALPGMTPAELRQALGGPAGIRVVLTAEGESASWTYLHGGGVRQVVRLKDGAVVRSDLQYRSRGAAPSTARHQQHNRPAARWRASPAPGTSDESAADVAGRHVGPFRSAKIGVRACG